MRHVGQSQHTPSRSTLRCWVADYSKYSRGTRSHTSGHDRAKDEDNTNKQFPIQASGCPVESMELTMYGAPHAFLSENEKELPKDPWGTTQHPQCQQGVRDCALCRNPPNHQQLPHAMEHIPGYVQQPPFGAPRAPSRLRSNLTMCSDLSRVLW
jgi:hypothetical protein